MCMERLLVWTWGSMSASFQFFSYEAHIKNQGEFKLSYKLHLQCKDKAVTCRFKTCTKTYKSSWHWAEEQQEEEERRNSGSIMGVNIRKYKVKFCFLMGKRVLWSITEYLQHCGRNWENRITRRNHPRPSFKLSINRASERITCMHTYTHMCMCTHTLTNTQLLPRAHPRKKQNSFDNDEWKMKPQSSCSKKK